MPDRIYAIKNKQTDDVSYIKASTKSQARLFMARELFIVNPVSAVEIAEALLSGAALLDATQVQEASETEGSDPHEDSDSRAIDEIAASPQRRSLTSAIGASAIRQ